MYYKFTPNEREGLLSYKPEEKMLTDDKMLNVYPKSQTLNFIKQFAYAYHSEEKLPVSINGIILN